MNNILTITFDVSTPEYPTVGDTYTLTQTDSFGNDTDLVWTCTDNFLVAQQPFNVYILQQPPALINNATLFEIALERDLNPALYSINRVEEVINVTAENENFAFSSALSTFEGVLFSSEFDLNPTIQRINVRSPFFVSAPVYDGTNLVSSINTKFDIYIYEGVLDVSKPTTPTYTYEKKPRFTDDNNIYIDISRQINDFINNTYNGLLITQSVFVEIDILNTYNGGTLTDNQKYLALNGFNLHGENVNHLPSKDVLLNNTSISVLQGENINIPFYRSGADYLVEFRENTTVLNSQNINSIPIINTNDIVENVLFQDAQTVNNIRILNTDTQEETFLDVEVITECIYDPVKITFVNRQGVLQDFYTYKVSKETIKATSENYNRSVLNESVISNIPVLSYNTSEHNKVDFNKQATKSIELNTGYIPEDNNIIIEEMLESEYIWLNLDTNIIPVNLSTKSVPLLTKINDQLIKYTLNFDFSYNEVQNIR